MFNFFIAVSQTSAAPLYEQVKNQLIEKISKYELKAGTWLPSIRVLAKELGISVITIKRVYEELERSGYIKTFPGKGSRVMEGGKTIRRTAEITEISALFRQGINRAAKINMKDSEIRLLFNEELNEVLED